MDGLFLIRKYKLNLQMICICNESLLNEKASEEILVKKILFQFSGIWSHLFYVSGNVFPAETAYCF
jgi:hypothetical protein